VAYTLEKQIAITAVVQASALCRAVRAEVVAPNSLAKEDKSPVTVADFGSQALICRQLSMAFPRDPIVGEEDSAALGEPKHATILAQITHYVQRFQSDATPEGVCRWIDAGKGEVAERFWTLDPIDGTKGFLRNDQYAVALALIEQGTVKLAVLGCPALPLDTSEPEGRTGVLFVAVRGAGAEMAAMGDLSFEPIRVVQGEDENRRRFVESVEAAHGNPILQEAVARAVGVTRPPLRMDSQAKYGVVARGDAALYLRLPSSRRSEYREKIWDHAAGALIVEEAGGCVSDMYGYPLDLAAGRDMQRNRGVVVSNGALHLAALETLASEMAKI